MLQTVLLAMFFGALLLLAVSGALYFWLAFNDVEMSGHGIFALILGVGVSLALEHCLVILNHSAGGIFRHDQESVAERISHTVKAVDAVMAKKAPARAGCVWAGSRGVAALTRCSSIAFRTAPGGLPRPNGNRIDSI